MQSRVVRIAPLLLGSGMCALIYQTAWLREMRLIFGSSTFASAAVLAIFMGGLGLGGAILGKRADRSSSPLALYGNLELAVAGFTAITPFLLDLARVLYAFTGGSERLGEGGATVVRMVLALLVLAAPTLAMGGTLPAAARAAETDDDAGRRSLAFLYAANTMGAVSGALLSTFLLIEVYGTRTTLWLACLVNALIGLVARSVARSVPAHAEAVASPAETSATAAESQELAASAPPVFVLASAGAVGFVFFLMELVWYRMLAPLLGGSTFTFGLVLAVALLGIGLGGLAYALWFKDRRATLRGFALTCLAEAVCIAIPFAVGDGIAIQAALLRPMGALGFGGLVTSWGIVSALVIFPAAFVSGVQFPLLVALLGRGGRSVGHHVGLAYAWNTVGSIIGSLAGGFGLLPGLGAVNVWRLCAALLVALGAAAVLFGLRRDRRWLPFTVQLGLGAAAVVLLFARGPTAAWRHTPIGAGRVNFTNLSPNGIEEWLRANRTPKVWEADGRESSVALFAGDGLAFIVNGKSDGNAIQDAPTQVMSGVLGALLHPNPKNAMVIGLGTGGTAGWLAHLPEVERVDVVEIESAILEVARRCEAVNEKVMSNPKVHTSVGDAREALTTTRNKYDIVFSEPSNPYRAGISSLFTQDFYRAVKRSLAPGAIFVQWMQAYEIDAGAIRTVLNTLGSEFPHVEIWATQGLDLLLLARQEAPVYDAEQLQKRISTPEAQQALLAGWKVSTVEGVLSRFLAGDAVTRKVVTDGLQPINTDDQNVMEFAFARNVGRQNGFDVRDLGRVARKLGGDRPTIKGTVDWQRVQYEKLLVEAALNRPLAPDTQIDPLVSRRFGWVPFAMAGRRGEALRRWRAERPEPIGPLDRGLLAEMLAADKDELAAKYAEEMKATQPIDAALVMAQLHYAKGEREPAVGALEAAFVKHRTHPWVLRWLMSRGVQLAERIAGQEPALAPRLYSALEQPFAAYDLEESRKEALLTVSRRGVPPAECAKTVALFEPEFPWNRPLLEWRVRCYGATQNPRLALAQRELEAFVDEEPAPFAPDLIGVPGMPTPAALSATTPAGSSHASTPAAPQSKPPAPSEPGIGGGEGE